MLGMLDEKKRIYTMTEAQRQARIEKGEENMVKETEKFKARIAAGATKMIPDANIERIDDDAEHDAIDMDAVQRAMNTQKGIGEFKRG